MLLWVLWLAATWAMYPNYDWLKPMWDAIAQQQMEQQLIYEDEVQRNFEAEQKEIIIEDYFLFLDKIWKIRYARWCAGEYGKATRSDIRNKRVKCSDNAYDCAGLVKGYAVAKWILTQEDIAHYNSQSLMSLSTKKDARTAKRGDRTSRISYGKNETGWVKTHFAMVSRDYSGDNILRIYDNANGPNLNVLAERPIKVRYVRSNFTYMNYYRIGVYTNGLITKAFNEWIVVDRWYDTDQEVVEQMMSSIDPNNPLNFSVTISWHDYNSLQNVVTSYRYDNSSGDVDMIASFIQESQLNPKALWLAWEKWYCQLLPNSTNNVWLNDPRREDPMRQAKICLEKRQAVPVPSAIRAGRRNRKAHMPRINIMRAK